MVDQLSSFADEVTRVAREVGTEGKLGGQAEVKGVSGTWRDLTENVNLMANNLTDQVRNIAEVTTAIANGDLSQKITVEAKGEVAALADTINSMTDTLQTFAEQVTSVAREVGTEGKLGGQADVPGVAGTWKDLTDNVNLMANNLTDPGAQHRRRRRPRSPNGRPDPGDHRRGQGRGRGPRRHDQLDDRHALSRSRSRSPASRARSAPRASSAARPRSPASPAPGRTSPTT